MTGSDVVYKKNDFMYSKPNSTFVRNFYSLSFNIQVCFVCKIVGFMGWLRSVEGVTS